MFNKLKITMIACLLMMVIPSTTIAQPSNDAYDKIINIANNTGILRRATSWIISLNDLEEAEESAKFIILDAGYKCDAVTNIVYNIIQNAVNMRCNQYRYKIKDKGGNITIKAK